MSLIADSAKGGKGLLTSKNLYNLAVVLSNSQSLQQSQAKFAQVLNALNVKEDIITYSI